jgi:signal transduction histidine kinase
MATIHSLATPWSRIRARLARAPSVGRDGLAGVALRLAGQTVGLLLVMLLVLEIVVYLITQQALLGSLESTLRTHAEQADPSVCRILQLPCGFGGLGPGGGPHPPGGQPGGTGGQQPPSGPGSSPGFRLPVGEQAPSDASAAFVDANAHLIHANGVLGMVLLDPADARQAVRTGEEQCCPTVQYRGQDYLVYTMPLSNRGKVVGAVQTSVSKHQYEGTIGSLQRALVIVAIIGLLISGAISVVLVRRALRPIRAAVQRQRDFVADAAHELRTPLAIMRTVGEVGMSSPSVDELQETVAQMLAENQHLTRLVEDLSLLARTDTDTVRLERRQVNLSTLVEDTSSELAYLAEEQGVTLTAEIQKGIRVMGDTLRLRQLLLILLDNALKHTPDGGAVRVELSGESGRARLRVVDSGPGIAPADLTRIFDRFYRSDQARTGEGSGLGLAIGRWIVEAHAGQIQASNVSPHGAVFIVTLPAIREAAA